MAGVSPAPEGNAASEKAAETAASKAAAEKAEADKAAAAAPAAAAKPKKGHVVTGAAVVLASEDGSERYLYRGAPVGDGFTKASIEHAISVGLIAKVK